MSETPSELDLLFQETSEEEGAESEEEAPRRRRRSSVSDKEIRDLNLTAMMDMMTILLVFLLKNYASDPENVQLSDVLQPPQSTSKIPLDPAVTITITKTGILVDDKPVAQVNLTDGTVLNEPEGGGQAIGALAEILDKKVADMKAFEARGGSPFEGKILIVADETMPYSLLMRVLYTAGTAHFGQYKLVVRSKNVSAADLKEHH